ncbi:MAG: cytidine deaminase [Marinilabiliales bacterium]|nr:MAG: cytidine deaminase [Marinilabiliales bacterium]
MKEREIQIRFNELKHEELNADDKHLMELAINAAKNAYAPYSNFRVGAAVLLDDGTIVSGNNQENAAYPSGLCAERVALFYANSNYPDNSVECITIVVIDSDDKIIPHLVSPCGSCRQVISETEMRYEKRIRILLVSEDIIMEFNSIQDLLPLSFNQKDLLAR